MMSDRTAQQDAIRQQIRDMHQRRDAKMIPRHQDIIQWRKAGDTWQTIATTLTVSRHTIQAHRQSCARCHALRHATPSLRAGW